MLFALAPAADAENGSITDDEWRRIIRPTTVNFYNTYIQHSNATAVPFNTDKVWYVGEDANYTFKFYPSTYSFTIDAQKTESMGTAGWRTYSTGNYEGSNGYTISGSDVSAYYIGGTDGNKATLTSIASGAVIPTKAGIMLKGSGTFTVNTTATNGTALTNNMLVGSGSDKINVPTETGYILAGSGSSLGFYPIASSNTEISAHKAYLDLPSTSRSFDFISLNGETTGVADVKDKMDVVGGDFFNLAGQQVAHPTKGLYIVNGKKVIIK